MSITFVFVIFLSLIASGITGIQTPDRSLREVKERFEADVLDLRFEAQRVYASYKCDPAKLLQSCQQSNYDACRSSFPNPRCDSEHKHGDNVCGRFENGTTAADKNNASCHGMVADPTVTSIYVPSFSPTNFYDNGTTMDPLLVEDICISHRLEEYFVEKADSASSPQSMFFAGAATGLLRIYPARTLPFCDDSSSAWDPRQEPWYQLATRAPASGKTVVILLDTSRSMNQRLEHLRGPVRHVIDTLNDGVDRLAIVPFSTAAYEITVEEAVLVPITRTTKRHLLQLVDQLLTMEAGGSTNMMAAFEKTFEILEYGMMHNMAEESCFTVILFFTDGSMTDPPGKTEQDVIDFINHGLSRAENMLQQPVFTLIYSVVDGVTGDDDDRTVSFPKTLACSSARASWASLNTHTRVHESLAGYDALVEWGLQPRSSSNFTAWAEPYLFAASAAAVGISITAPVFGPDNQLIGVVGIEVSLDDLRAASKEEGNMTLDAFPGFPGTDTRPLCPSMLDNLDRCALMSLSRVDPGTSCGCNNVTSSNATFFDRPMNSSCAGTRTVKDYQMNVFANTALESKPYKERACCSALPFMAEECKDFDEKESTINDEASNKTTITIHVDVDPDNELPVSGPVLVWSILPLFAAGIALVALVWYKRRRDDDDAEEDGEQSPEDRSEGPPEETNPSEP